jgi:predicted RNA-binding Zn-ribbon protein involved in translation (DUF1610 family)
MKKTQICKSCGENIRATYDFCPKCGKENSGNTKFCANCGTGLERQNSGLTQKDLKTKLKPVESDNSDEIVALDLTPAESLIILNHHTLTKELLKVTFIDLIFKNVFKSKFMKLKRKAYLEGKWLRKPIFMREKI